MIICNIVTPIKQNLNKSHYAYELMHKTYTPYIPPCEDILMAIMQNKQSYDENMQKIMTEQVYNMLSLTTKSWYRDDFSIPSTKLKIIDEFPGKNNPHIIYLDVMIIYMQSKDLLFGYHIGYGEIKAEKSNDSWKLIYYSGDQGKAGKYYQEANFIYSNYDKISICYSFFF